MSARFLVPLTLTLPLVLCCQMLQERRLVREFRDAYDSGKLQEAVSPATQLLNRAEGSTDLSRRIAALDRLGEVEMKLRQLDSAMGHYERAVRELEAAGQPGPVELAQILRSLGAVYQLRDRYADAERVIRRAIDLLKPTGDPLLTSATKDLGQLYSGQGRYAEAEPLLSAALTQWEQTKGLESVEVGSTAALIAMAQERKPDYEASRVNYERAITVLERALGPQHPELALVLGYYCSFETRLGAFARAEVLCKRSIQAYEHSLGGASEGPMGQVLDALGRIYMGLGRLQDAEPLFMRSRDAFAGSQGPRGLGVAVALGDLGSLYLSQGLLEEGSRLLQESLEIRKEHAGTGIGTEAIADGLYTLARAAARREDYASATQYAEDALQTWAGINPDHANLGRATANLAAVCKNPCRLGERSALAKRAVEIDRRRYGEQHPRFAESLMALGAVQLESGRYRDASSAFRLAESVLESSVGILSPNTKQALRALAWSEARSGRPRQALAAFDRMEAVEENQLQAFLGAVPEARQRAFLEDARTSLDHLVTFQQRSLPVSQEAQRLVLRALLRRKARALDTTSAQFRIARGALEEGSDRSLLELRDVRGDLAALLLRGPTGLSFDVYRERVEALQVKQRALEDAVARSGAGPRSNAVSVESVGAQLPRRSALLEMVRYVPPLDRARPRYALYGLKHEGRTITALDMGDASELERLVDAILRSIEEPVGGAAAQYSRALDQKVLQPLAGFLGDVDHVFLAPDGAFHLVPFAALTDPQGRFRVERWEFSYLDSGRDLLAMAATDHEDAPREPALVMGGADFDWIASASTPRDVASKANSGPGATRSKDFGQMSFSALPSTVMEATAVANALGVRPILRSAAREERVKAARSPLVLHVATHAFFLKDLPRAGERSMPGTMSAEPLPTVKQQEDPMLRSGLALTGANVRDPGADDGILTALEVSTLDLSGTELVVLSACDTGVGDIDRGEGVLGLRRAFALAGARSLLMSLWRVNDVATTRLMAAYYARLKQGEGRSAALRAVQRQFLKDPVLREPYYWAPFILAGRPGEIPQLH